MAERRLSVMISSTSELHEHCEAVSKIADSAGFPTEWIEFPSGSGETPIDASRKMIEKADIFILVLGHRYGFIPPGSDVSATEMEYDWALKLPKPRLAFIMHEDHPIAKEMIEQGLGAAKLAAFKERVNIENVVEFFMSPADLAQLALSSLMELRANWGKEKKVAPERVSTQEDTPAIIDELGRRPFAEVIGDRIEDVWLTRSPAISESRPADAFTVHIEGPWGAGKTSLLNFLREHLQNNRNDEKRWIVVNFNAWKHQRIRPPWWTLIREIYVQSASQMGFRQSFWLRCRWWMWCVWTDLFPLLAAFLAIAAAVLVAMGYIDFIPDNDGTAEGGTAEGGTAEGGTAQKPETGAVAKSVELGLKIVVALVVAGGTVSAMSRSLLFGSTRAAQTYIDLRSDPLGMIARLFEKLINASSRPVLIFIDDLDRCEAKYVVELLEGIQTLFKAQPITYVVAADRKWICSSFEQVYEDFGDAIGAPGRPLGYLFLDKIFQVSVSVPKLLPRTRRQYWSSLLAANKPADNKGHDQDRIDAEKDARRQLANVNNSEDMEAFIAEAKDNPLEEQARRAAAAREITAKLAKQETEHRLEPFAELLEPNPRSMKRLVNAVGLHQAKHFIEGRSVSLEALARWTIIELRWPLLAELLTVHPHLVTKILEGAKTPDEEIPKPLAPLFSDPEVYRVITASCGPNRTPLSEVSISQIAGQVTVVEAGPDANDRSEGGLAIAANG